MSWEVDGRAEKHVQGDRQGAEAAPTSCSSPPTRTARARRSPGIVREVLKERQALKGVDGQARRLQRDHQERRARRDPQPARARRRAGRGLSGAPRARLPRRLHAVAGAVAQAAGQPLGRPRAVGGAAPDLRARSRDRGVQAPRILDDRGRVPDRGRATASPPASRISTARSSTSSTSTPRRRRRRRRRRDPARPPASPSPRSSTARSRRNPPPPFTTSTLQQEASRKLGFGASRTMRSPSGSTKASTSTARRSASSPICAPTACDLSPEAIAAARQLIGHELRRATTCRTQPRVYKATAKNAQEAHEAIRPTDLSRQPGACRAPSSTTTSAGSTS